MPRKRPLTDAIQRGASTVAARRNPEDWAWHLHETKGNQAAFEYLRRRIESDISTTNILHFARFTERIFKQFGHRERAEALEWATLAADSYVEAAQMGEHQYFLNAARLYSEIGETAYAIDLYWDAIENNTENEDAVRELATIFYQQNQPNEALALIADHAAVAPRLWELISRHETSETMDELATESALQSWIKSGHQTARATNSYGFWLFGRGQLDDAIVVFEYAEERLASNGLFPWQPQTHAERLAELRRSARRTSGTRPIDDELAREVLPEDAYIGAEERAEIDAEIKAIYKTLIKTEIRLVDLEEPEFQWAEDRWWHWQTANHALQNVHQARIDRAVEAGEIGKEIFARLELAAAKERELERLAAQDLRTEVTRHIADQDFDAAEDTIVRWVAAGNGFALEFYGDWLVYRGRAADAISCYEECAAQGRPPVYGKAADAALLAGISERETSNRLEEANAREPSGRFRPIGTRQRPAVMTAEGEYASRSLHFVEGMLPRDHYLRDQVVGALREGFRANSSSGLVNDDAISFDELADVEAVTLLRRCPGLGPDGLQIVRETLGKEGGEHLLREPPIGVARFVIRDGLFTVIKPSEPDPSIATRGRRRRERGQERGAVRVRPARKPLTPEREAELVAAIERVFGDPQPGSATSHVERRLEVQPDEPDPRVLAARAEYPGGPEADLPVGRRFGAGFDGSVSASRSARNASMTRRTGADDDGRRGDHRRVAPATRRDSEPLPARDIQPGRQAGPMDAGR